MRTLFLGLGLSAAALFGACVSSEPSGSQPGPSARPAPAAATSADAAPGSAALDPADLTMFKILPRRFDREDNVISEAKVELGRMLFYETRISKNHDLSCNSCHDLAAYGVDGQRFSAGHKGQLGGRNSPTVYNAGNHVAQFWDGRAATLEEQAKGPILNPVEMAMPSAKAVVDVLKSIPGYIEKFKAAFPGSKEPITYDNVAMAIGAFERQLVTPSRFDRYLAGDTAALGPEEVVGFQKFMSLGCTTCHAGEAIGGSTFQKLGLVKPYPDLQDLGRYDVTKDEKDKHYFRVPSLRNVSKTAPYFHDGSLSTLDEVVRKMAFHQLGVELSEHDTKVLVAFLGSLTGTIPAAYIKRPELPPSGPKTPAPDPR